MKVKVKVKVRKTPSPPPSQAVPTFEWGDRTQAVPRTVPTPRCAYPRCPRRAIIIGPIQSDPNLRRISRWCSWHLPDRNGIRRADVMTPHIRRDPAAPPCLIPGCNRVREVKFRPMDRDTLELAPAIRFPTCAAHRRTMGRFWKLHVPPQILAPYEAALQEEIERERAIRRTWKQAILEAREVVDRETRGAHHPLAHRWNPQAFLAELQHIDRDHIIKKHYYLKHHHPPSARMPALTKLHDEWQARKANKIEPFAPTLDQWQSLFEYLDTYEPAWQPGQEIA